MTPEPARSYCKNTVETVDQLTERDINDHDAAESTTCRVVAWLVVTILNQ